MKSRIALVAVLAVSLLIGCGALWLNSADRAGRRLIEERKQFWTAQLSRLKKEKAGFKELSTLGSELMSGRWAAVEDHRTEGADRKWAKVLWSTSYVGIDVHFDDKGAIDQYQVEEIATGI
ncbi:hypothetical protein [Fimbriimonas ginsengisoli]|uniref:Lipoprotein n=1 Tax=Fimbriimonas ginsengisoli Gsoil 348 TaxID=661478 RepID=A0A068NWV8_FIMGI|nr:hypothetical protein [Fimbriimonas ginsengisoli]AIE86064.1 hypothetical protein OP10G_2696 [Fimbriimonas ginsengisoli Gsoil 348]